MRRFWVGLCASLVFVAPVTGQSWDTPSFFPPLVGDEVGLYATGLGGNAALAGIWRQTGQLNMEVRGGLTVGDATLVSVGASTFGALDRWGAQIPLDLLWTAGVGATFGDWTQLRAPIGLSIGLPLRPSSGLTLIPYLHPRVALEIDAVGDRASTDFEGAIEVGLSAVLGNDWSLRFAGTIGDGGGAGVGVAWHVGRSVRVR